VIGPQVLLDGPVNRSGVPRSALRQQTLVVTVLLAGGVASGVLWRAVLPFALRHSDQQESFIAVDGSFALIGLAAGLLTGLTVVVRPSRSPGVRTGVAVVGAIAASALAAMIGMALGAPAPAAVGIILAWPVTAALVIFIGAFLPVTSRFIARV
jgi:hypothetical protein